MANLKQPRASIACSRNRDPDYLGLAIEGVEGLAAVALFDALLCAAKDQGNGGVFDLPMPTVAMLVGIEINLFSKLIQKLIGLKWVLVTDSGLVIRSFLKWNKPEERGGAREGAGRPPKGNNQSEIKAKSNKIQTETAPLPLPSPLPVKENSLGDFQSPKPPPVENKKPSRPKYTQPFEAFWREYPRKDSKLEAFKAWQKLDEDDQRLAWTGARLFARIWAEADPRGERRQFQPHGSTWLNGRRWESDEDAIRLQASSNGNGQYTPRNESDVVH